MNRRQPALFPANLERSPMIRAQRGFTLIELMIVVAIIAILAGIAYPGYQDVIRKTRRADAKKDLVGLANALERYHTENDTYIGSADGSDKPQSTVYPGYSPSDGDAAGAVYQLTATDLSASQYTLTATPVNNSSNDGDGDLTLDNLGRRLWDQHGAGTLVPWE